MKLYIRNMACESCKLVVANALKKLKVNPVKVELGEALIKGDITGEQKQKINAEIKRAGLELVENQGSIIIERIRRHIIEYISFNKKPSVNFSDYLSQKLNYDYNYLSNLFTEVEATNISTYMNSIKMERAKEMILFENLSLTEISKKLHYTHLSHFSAQFRQTTGFSPSHFKKLKAKRLSIQSLRAKK